MLSAIQSAADLLGNLKAMGETKDPAEGHNRFEAYAVSPYCPEAKVQMLNKSSMAMMRAAVCLHHIVKVCSVCMSPTGGAGNGF